VATHRDDHRDRYETERERLELVIGAPENTDGPGTLRGNVSERDAEAIGGVRNAPDPEVHGATVRAHGDGRETKEAKTLANDTSRF
jgi:hypothetical protein